MARKRISLCKTCVRYHPKAQAHCILARDCDFLQEKHKYVLMVIDCPHYVTPEEVFPIEEVEEEAIEQYDEEAADLSPDDFMGEDE